MIAIKMDEIFIRDLNNSEEDFKLLYSWLNRYDVIEFYGDSKNKDYKYVKEKYTKKIQDDNETPCIIEYKNEPIGYLQFYEVTPENYSLSKEQFEKLACDDDEVYAFDIFLGKEEYRNQGIGTKIINYLIEIFFNYLNIDVLLVDPIAENSRAINCYTKCGFKECFVAQNREEKDGSLHDNIIMIKENDNL